MNITDLFDSNNFEKDCKTVPTDQIKTLLKKLKLKTNDTKDNLCHVLTDLFNTPQEEFIDKLYITQYKQGACEKYSTQELFKIAKERNMSEKWVKTLSKRDMCKSVLMPYHPNWIPNSVPSINFSGTCNSWNLKDLQRATGDYTSTKEKLCAKYLDNKKVLRSIDAEKTLVSVLNQKELACIKEWNISKTRDFTGGDVELSCFEISSEYSNDEHIPVLNSTPEHFVLYSGDFGKIIKFACSDSIVGKIANNESLSPSSMIHEVCIGIHLNKLKQECNWMKTLDCYYGDIQGGFNTIGIFNFIKGTHLNKVIIEDNLGLNDILIIILQILLALQDAQKMYMFMHYDLHIDNILVKSQETKFVVNGITFTSKYCPVIVDYGESIITVNSDVFLKNQLQIPVMYIHQLRFTDKYFVPLWDSWRLLSSLIGFMGLKEIEDYVDSGMIIQLQQIITEFYYKIFKQCSVVPKSDIINKLFDASESTENIFTKYLDQKGKILIEDILPFKLSLKTFIDFLISKITN